MLVASPCFDRPGHLLWVARKAASGSAAKREKESDCDGGAPQPLGWCTKPLLLLFRRPCLRGQMAKVLLGQQVHTPVEPAVRALSKEDGRDQLGRADDAPVHGPLPPPDIVPVVVDGIRIHRNVVVLELVLRRGGGQLGLTP